MPQRRWLEHYASQYATVENNNSFYRLPSRDTFAAWRDRTPDGFVMAVKASRYLTHIRRLRDPAEPVARLLGAAAGLGPRLGPVLLQLPPNLAADPPLLAALPGPVPGRGPGRGHRPGPGGGGTAAPVLVGRGPGERGAAGAGRARRGAVLGGPAGPSGQPAVAHGRLGLPPAARGRGAAVAAVRPRRRCAPGRSGSSTAWPAAADVYVYFNNDPGGAAVRDSVTFAALAGRAGLTVTRTPAASCPAGG